MTDVIVGSLIASCAGGALSLDRTAAFQTMVSRPIVTAPVIGYLLGSVTTGLVAGSVLELLLMGDLPVGAYVPMHETAIATAVTALSVVVSGSLGLSGAVGAGGWDIRGAAAVIPVVLCLVFPVAFLYRRADNYTRVFNARFFHSSSESLDSGARVSLPMENLKGMAPAFLATTGALIVTVLPLSVIARAVLSSVAVPWGGASPLRAAAAGCVVLAIGSAVVAVSTGARSLLIYLASAIGAGLVMVLIL